MTCSCSFLSDVYKDVFSIQTTQDKLIYMEISNKKVYFWYHKELEWLSYDLVCVCVIDRVTQHVLFTQTPQIN